MSICKTKSNKRIGKGKVIIILRHLKAMVSRIYITCLNITHQTIACFRNLVLKLSIYKCRSV